MDGATSLGRKGTASILAAIKAKGGRPAIIKDLLGINNHAQIRNGLRAMEEDGLIELSVGLAEHKTIQIRLTPLGEEAANALELMERFIYGGPTEDSCLDMRYCSTLLLRIKALGHATQNEVLAAVPSYKTVVKTLAALDEGGLVAIERNPDNGRLTITLTTLGETCAGIYTMLEDKIKAGRKADARGRRKGFQYLL